MRTNLVPDGGATSPATRLVGPTSSGLCLTCFRPDHSPTRIYVGDKIHMGCVDAFHDDHLTPCSQSAAWHNRPEAKAIRRRNARELANIKSGK